MKRLLLTAALALSLFAEGGVLVTPNGKTYHSRKCMALARSTEIYTVTLEAAREHKLKPCGICYRPATKGKKDNDWMKGEKAK